MSFDARTSPEFSVDLHPFDAPGGAVTGLRAGLWTPPGGGMRVHYMLEGRMDELKIPLATSPLPEPAWKHLCFELFLNPKGGTAYREYNFSTDGRWTAYDFHRYRERAPDMIVPNEENAPYVQASRSDTQLSFFVDLPGVILPRSTMFKLGISVVIETLDGRLAYWALTHPMPQPDFHHADGWLLRLEPKP